MNKNKAKSIVFVLLTIICIAVLVYSLYQGLIIYIPQKQEQHRFIELQKIVSQEFIENEPCSENADNVESRSKFSEIVKMNGDFRAWLKINETIIDYPVLKSPEDTPEYYLHRDFDKNYSFSGTPFIGAGADENSDVFVVYAHNMNNDTMFGTLDNYTDIQWAKQHPDVEFDTLEENRVYHVFAAFKTTVGSENEFKYSEKAGNLNDDEFFALINEIRDNSITDIDDCPTQKTQILLLSTCSYHAENGRFVVAAYKIHP